MRRISYVVSLIADVMFVGGLFVQGGDFWDKLRAPYIHSARAEVHGQQ